MKTYRVLVVYEDGKWGFIPSSVYTDDKLSGWDEALFAKADLFNFGRDFDVYVEAVEHDDGTIETR